MKRVQSSPTSFNQCPSKVKQGSHDTYTKLQCTVQYTTKEIDIDTIHTLCSDFITHLYVSMQFYQFARIV